MVFKSLLGIVVVVFMVNMTNVTVDGQELDEFTILKAYCEIMLGSDVYVQFQLKKRCHINARIFDRTVSFL